MAPTTTTTTTTPVDDPEVIRGDMPPEAVKNTPMIYYEISREKGITYVTCQYDPRLKVLIDTRSPDQADGLHNADGTKRSEFYYSDTVNRHFNSVPELFRYTVCLSKAFGADRYRCRITKFFSQAELQDIGERMTQLLKTWVQQIRPMRFVIRVQEEPAPKAQEPVA